MKDYKIKETNGIYEEVEGVCNSVGKIGMLVLDAVVLIWIIKILLVFSAGDYYGSAAEEIAILKLLLLFIFMAIRANRFYGKQ